MFKLSKFWKTNPVGVVIGDVPSTLIGEGISLDGATLTGKDSVRVDGILKGNVNIENSFTIGEAGTIIGNISAKSVIIAGSVVGDINGDSIVHLTSTAKVVGDIEAINIIIDEGAKIRGRYMIGNIEKDFEFNPIKKPGAIFNPIKKPDTIGEIINNGIRLNEKIKANG